MSSSDRRQFLKGLLGTLARAAGAVVLASTAATAQARQQPPPRQPGESDTPPDDLRSRADRLAASADGEDMEAAAAEFLNGFRNAPGWHNGFRNGGWHNGGFRNGGGFHNGGWPNGGFGNGGFRNGGFRNGNTWLNW